MIRVATLDDLYDIEEIEQLSFGPEIAWDRMELEYQIKRGRMWVSEVFTGPEMIDKKVVGYVCVKIKYGNGWIDGIAVLPDYRGLCHGRDLVLYAVGLLETMGAECCTLDCETDLVSFYSQWGFRVCGYSHGHYAGEDMVVMRRVL